MLARCRCGTPEQNEHATHESPSPKGISHHDTPYSQPRTARAAVEPGSAAGLTILAGGGAAMAAHALQANAPAAIYPWRPGMYAAPAATQAAPSDDGSPSAPQKPRLSDGVTKLRSIVPTQPWRYPLGLSVCCR